MCDTAKSVNLFTNDFNLKIAIKAWPASASCVSENEPPVVNTTSRYVILLTISVFYIHAIIVKFYISSFCA